MPLLAMEKIPMSIHANHKLLSSLMQTRLKNFLLDFTSST